MLNVDERLAAALSSLEAILDRSGAAIVPLLHPGIGQPEVLAAFDGIGLSPSAEVVTWFGWHDGAGGPGMPTTLIELVPGGEFYGAHHLCREYVQARSVALEVASTPRICHRRPGSTRQPTTSGGFRGSLCCGCSVRGISRWTWVRVMRHLLSTLSGTTQTPISVSGPRFGHPSRL
jgi:hypothetical protein